ncbi:helix-turn-helix transcriptional regulator [Rhodobacter sp. 24-YEA-8]|uniref:helix-turn-helix transcriptional regulator n=1 Tax=Rhodobacter sp. 24-YEA-8 TaxID=1884310 RepID=UPI0008983001|nr:helix-turn-helix transcriptional regulator [Rhodobacter sp. 24-YEA-8]SEB91340.1 transcriptional regulator, LuxR family [Rhodobacter sp. 24-YEA-8]
MDLHISPERLSALIARIYDCALDPSLWPDAMGAICDELDLRTGVVSLIDLGTGQPLLASATGFDPAWLGRLHEFSDGLVSLWGGEAVVRNMPLEEPAVLSAVNPVAISEESADPFHLGFNQPQGFVDAIAVGLTRDETMLGTIGFNRHESHGLVGPREIAIMRLLVPHLQRAIAVSRVLEMQQIRQTNLETALHAIRAPLFMIDSDLHLHFHNSAAEKVVADSGILRVVNGTLILTDPEAQRRVRKALLSVGACDDPAKASPFGTAFTDAENAPWVAHVLPITGRAGSAGAQYMLFLAGPSLREGSAALEALASLYALTGAETQVLQRLCTGQSAKQIAEDLGIALSTLKTHTLRIYEKTGLHRQAELVALARGALAPV